MHLDWLVVVVGMVYVLSGWGAGMGRGLTVTEMQDEVPGGQIK